MNVSDLIPYITPEVPRCPNVLITDAIIRAARSLCSEGLVHIDNDCPVTMAASTQTFGLVSQLADTEVAQYLGPSFQDTRELTDLTEGKLALMDPNYRTYTGQYVTHVYTRTPRLLGVYPLLDPTATLTELLVGVALRPTLTAPTLDDAYAGDYRDAIAAGARGILMDMKNKPWSDVAGAKENAAIFRVAIGDARVRQAGPPSGEAMVRFPGVTRG